MAETSGFFEAVLNEDTQEYDLEYLASQFAEYFSLFIGNGVFSSPTNQLKVSTAGGLNVKVAIGFAFINGYWYKSDAVKYFAVPANLTSLPRTDTVRCRWNNADRKITTEYFVGGDENVRDGQYYDLMLAKITIPAGATEVTAAYITDTRMNDNVCGFVNGIIDVTNTEDLFAQYTAIFNEWFDNIKDQISTDLGTQLSTEIGNLKNLKTTAKDNLVNAVNEVETDVEGLKDGKVTAKKALQDGAGRNIRNFLDRALQVTAFNVILDQQTEPGRVFVASTSDGTFPEDCGPGILNIGKQEVGETIITHHYFGIYGTCKRHKEGDNTWSEWEREIDSTGGTIEHAEWFDGLKVHRKTSNGTSLIRYSNDAQDLGWLGFDAQRNPVIFNQGNQEVAGNASILLHALNFMNYALSLKGGQLTGLLKEVYGDINYSWRTNSNVQGYMNVLSINTAQSYIDSPIEFTIISRVRPISTKVSILFSGNNTTDPPLKNFIARGGHEVYIKKTTTSTWDVYVKTNTVQDMITISELKFGEQHISKLTERLTYKTTFLQELPSDTQRATTRIELSAFNIDELLTPEQYYKANTNDVTGTLPPNWQSDAFELDVDYGYGSNRTYHFIKGIFQRKIAFRVYTGTWSEWQYLETSGVTLWENPNPRGTLSSTTLEGLIGSVKSVEVVWRPYSSSKQVFSTGRVPLNTDGEETDILLKEAEQGNENVYRRTITFNLSTNEINIGIGWLKKTSGESEVSTVGALPIKITGYYY